MRFALALFSLALPLLAQDSDGPAGEPAEPFDPAQAESLKTETAASLFYRAFWIEQAQRNGAEAEKLYADVIRKHADAPEAPRAYLALIRLRAARGSEVADLVRKLEEDYPKLVKEIERARKLAARLRSEFDPLIKKSDTPLMLKLKRIYPQLLSNVALSSDDKDFLSDIGAVGHPMLAALLRSSTSGAVKGATSLLIQQNSPAAYAVIDDALRDASILYRMTIIRELGRWGSATAQPMLMKTLRDLWPSGSRSLRRRIAETWGMGISMGSPTYAQCYGYLAMAIDDPDREVRESAATLRTYQSHELRPEAYVAAVLARCLKLEPEMNQVWAWLPWQLPHKKLAPDIIKAVAAFGDGILIVYPKPGHAKITDEFAIESARMVIARCNSRKLNRSDGTWQYATLAAMNSAKAANMLLDASLRNGEPQLARSCGVALIRRQQAGQSTANFTAGAAELRSRALEQSYDADVARRTAAEAVLATLGVGAADLDAVVRAAQAHPDGGIARIAMSSKFLAAVGAQNAVKLVAVASDAQLDALSNAGQRCWGANARPAGEPNRGYPFWAAMLDRFQPTAAQFTVPFQLSGESPEYATLVAGWMLARHEPEFGWNTPGGPAKRNMRGGSLTRNRHLVAAFSRDAALRARLYASAADPRHEIGKLALNVADSDGTEAALVAYRASLDSPWHDLVGKSLDKLRNRGAAGSAILVEFLQRPDLTEPLRKRALQEFDGSAAKAQLPFVRQRLEARCRGYEAAVMWDVAFEYDPVQTTERALQEALGSGPAGYRTAALDVLTRAADARRIPIFRKVLREDSDTDRVHLVLRTVATQYLIELGPEVLLHLRNPDNGIRTTATEAIERLKFYAEAKKLFDTEKK